MKYVSLVLLGLLMAVLAGCGGGGDDGVARTLEEDLALVQADLEAAQSELATTKADLEAREAELTTAQADLATAQSELATTKETLTTTQETLTTTQTDLVDANADLEDKEAELATTKADLMTTETELDTAEDQLTTARINLATATANLTNAQANLMTAQADLTAAETDLEEKTTELTTTQAELATAKANLTAEQSDLLDAQVALKTAQDALAAETAKLTMAQSDLATARANLAAETAKLTTAQSALTAAQTRANNLQTQVTTLTNTVASLRTQLGQAQQQVTDTQTTANQQISTLEQTTRSDALLKALNPPNNPYGDTTLVQVTVPSRGSLRITAPNYSTSSVSGVPTGFRAARLRRTSGSSQFEIVAYTDRELNRRLIDHYGYPVDAREFGVTTVPGTDNALTPTNVIAPSNWKVSHGFSTSVSTIPTDMDKDATSYSGSFHGQSGSFNCGTNCRVELTATYDETADSQNKHALEMVAMTTIPTDQTVFFRPGSSARIYLDSATGTSAGIGADGQYMIFGWWKNTPESATGTYDFDAFMQTSATPIPASGTATYDGPAVGAYVEQGLLVGESGGARHGEFSATAHLNVVSGAVTGYVDGFRAKPNGSSSTVSKSWRVNLETGDAVTVSLTGQGGGAASGDWDAEFLPNHTHSRANDGTPQPLTAVGRFNASIAELLHVAGAFGVHRTVPE